MKHSETRNQLAINAYQELFEGKEIIIIILNVLQCSHSGLLQIWKGFINRRKLINKLVGNDFNGFDS